jgi:hypothetical protein
VPDVNLMYEYSLATVPTFYAQVERAFAFLPSTYNYRLQAQRLDALEDFRDTEAMVVYLGEKIEVDIIWDWPSALVVVTLREVQIARVSPRDQTPLGEAKERPRVIRLYDLAAVRGHADDPDFLLGDSDQFGGRITTKRFKLLQRDLAGVLDGLARATERYASDLLRGDLSIYPEVRAYYVEKRRAQGYW